MINIFKDLNLNIETIHTIPQYKWINITGFMKAGKTEFCINLANKLRTIYFDLERGTKPYIGTFIDVDNLTMFREKMSLITNNIEKLKPQLIIIDPIDRLADMIAKWYLKDKNIDNLGDIPYGQGWATTRDILKNLINHCFTLVPLLITVTHVKLSILDESRNNVTFLDMDLPGKTKQYVQAVADGHAIFSRAENEKKENYLKITFDNSSPSILSFAGSRIKEFYSVKNAEDLHKIILNNFKEK